MAAYGSGGSEDPLVAVVRLPAGQTVSQPAVLAGLRAGFAAAAAAATPGPERSRVVSYASTGSRAFVSADGRTTFAVHEHDHRAAGTPGFHRGHRDKAHE